MFFCCECCMLSVRGLCDELITRPDESYRLWRVVVCDLETSRMWRPWPALGRGDKDIKKMLLYTRPYTNIYICMYVSQHCGAGSSVGIATYYWTVQDWIPVGTRFSARPDRPWGPPSLL